MHAIDITNSIKWDLPIKPYPSAGGIYELEIFPLIVKCEGLQSGLYYHNPFEHKLVLINGNLIELFNNLS